MKQFTIVLFILFFGFPLCAQSQIPSDNPEANLDAYFAEPRESLYLHLNKQVYVTGEHLWFSGYVYDRKEGMPFTETRNVHIGLYDAQGRRLQRHLFHAKNGYLSGQMYLDSTIATGHYQVRAMTNWMRNFNEDDSFQVQIEIHNGSRIPIEGIGAAKPDVQFMPEGGHLVSNTRNTVGVKVVDGRGFGKQISSGMVQNEKGKSIAEFTVNDFGLGKFVLFPKEGIAYAAKVTFNDGSTETYKLPALKREGIAMTTRSVGIREFSVAFTTNKKTLSKIKDKKFQLLVHQNGESRSFDLDFSSGPPVLALGETDLFRGMNVLTLFDDQGRPLLERLCFNASGIDFRNSELIGIAWERDSLNVDLKLPHFLQQGGKVSVSVLPVNTLSQGDGKSIWSEIHLRPYVKGKIENARWYFDRMTPEKHLALDLLLLTQGWSRYDWEAIKNGPPKIAYDFEKGIDFEMKLKTKLKRDEWLYLHPDEHNDYRLFEVLPGQKTISVDNYIPYQDSELVISKVVKKKGVFREAEVSLKEDYGFYGEALGHSTQTDFFGLQKRRLQRLGIINSIESAPSYLQSVENEIKLEEVTVKAPWIPPEYKFIPRFHVDKVIEVDEDAAGLYPYVTDLIRANGYQVFDFFDPNSRSMVRIFSTRMTSVGTPAIPFIYLDGTNLVDFNPLYKLRTSEIQSIFINKSGVGEGLQGAGGVMRINTRRTGTPLEIEPETEFRHEFEKGFVTPKSYYAPKYDVFSKDLFQQYAAIHWEPEVQVGINGKAAFKIPPFGRTGNLLLFVEGMGSQGGLESSVLEVDLNVMLED